jgi:hypothetical protein
MNQQHEDEKLEEAYEGEPEDDEQEYSTAEEPELENDTRGNESSLQMNRAIKRK